MQPEEESAITHAEGALGLLLGQERSDAEELLAFCRAGFDSPSATLEQTARVGRLVEVLARRSATAMPYAALGRALLAHLRGAERDKRDLLNEFTTKMAMLGM